METTAIIVLIIIGLGNAALLTVLFFRKKENNSDGFKNQFDTIEKNQDRGERSLREEIAKNREELSSNTQKSRQEMTQNLNTFAQSLLARLTEISTLQKNQLDTFSKQLSTLTQSNEQKLEHMRKVVEEKLQALQQDNNLKLEKMRETVDEKLHSTLEKRLGESFKVVSDRLEKVHQGLGEMQNLALGVGDLKKVLMNVKTRGTMAEVWLGNLLEEILSPEQFEKNMVTKKGSRDPVEFAIKYPGRDGAVVYLPIDAKFPVEDYERLQIATEEANAGLIEEAAKAIESRIKLEAKNIRDKYLDPPHTTDFGILFLPTEGLFAEVLRRPGLVDLLRRDFKVVVTGPTTILAFLNSLQMGFRTLAVEKRASEVWSLLGEVKTQFGNFGTLLDKTKEKLQQASENIDKAAQKSRTIERKLKDVQGLPAAASTPALEQNEAHASIE